MIPILLAVAAGAATGLSTSHSTTMDTMEYEHVIQVVVSATQHVQQCRLQPKQDIAELKASVDGLIEYQSHIAKAQSNLSVSQDLKEMVMQFKQKDRYSVRYCQHKLSEIQAMSRTLARAMGGLNKFNICDSDVSVRYDLYKESYDKGQLSSLEFQELTDDILKLTEADKSNCSLENRVKLEQALKAIQQASSLIPLK